MTGFERVVGIDWSGAKGGRQKVVAAADCGADGSCRVVAPRSGRALGRVAVLDDLEAQPPATLAGLDVAFSLPWPEEGPLPAHRDQPGDVRASWRAVDGLCRREPDLDAGRVCRPAGGRLAAFVLTKLDGQPL